MWGPWGRDPSTSVVTDEAADDTALRDARDAVLDTGDWHPAAALLAATGPDPELRSRRVDVLADAVLPDPDWADRWLDMVPDDPSALLVRGCGEIAMAFDARGAGVEPTGEIGEFRSRLGQARIWCEQAVATAPHDPAARVPMLQLAIYQDEPAAEFRRRWDTLTALDPLHRTGHETALRYWFARWGGSHEQMYAFARGAVAAAPSTWTVLLPLEAHVEWTAREKQEGPRRAVATVTAWEESPQIRADIDAALSWAAAEPEVSLRDLTLLGYALYQANRMAQAHAVFVRAGLRAFVHPWYHSRSGAERAFRRAVRTSAAMACLDRTSR